MQFDQAGTLFAPVRWYFTPPGAADFPGSHYFASNDFQEHGYVLTDPGPYWNQIPVYDKGTPPTGLSGKGPPCGPLSWWQNGVPSSAPPLPLDNGLISLCCMRAIVQGGPIGPAIGTLWNPCQPWRVFGPPTRTFKRVLTGETWVTTLNTTVAYSSHGVTHTGEIVNVQPGGLGCQGFDVTKPPGFVTPSTGGPITMKLLTYNPVTFTGIWQMGPTSVRYPGEHFTWRNPTV
jgi:hypothetical protein